MSIKNVGKWWPFGICTAYMSVALSEKFTGSNCMFLMKSKGFQNSESIYTPCHPLVTNFTNPDNLTDDLFILKLFEVWQQKSTKCSLYLNEPVINSLLKGTQNLLYCNNNNLYFNRPSFHEKLAGASCWATRATPWSMTTGSNSTSRPRTRRTGRNKVWKICQNAESRSWRMAMNKICQKRER